jgi:class 3 adenylate cyclase
MLALAGDMLEVRTRAKLPPQDPADLVGARRDVCEDFARGTIRVRIGIHSGSAVAGVVGGLMPRYWCVARLRRPCSRSRSRSHGVCMPLRSFFGDAVNTASRSTLPATS